MGRVDTDVDTGGRTREGEGRRVERREGKLDTPDQGLSVISCSKYKDTSELGTCSLLQLFP